MVAAHKIGKQRHTQRQRRRNIFRKKELLRLLRVALRENMFYRALAYVPTLNGAAYIHTLHGPGFAQCDIFPISPGECVFLPVSSSKPKWSVWQSSPMECLGYDFLTDLVVFRYPSQTGLLPRNKSGDKCFRKSLPAAVDSIERLCVVKVAMTVRE